MDTKRCSRCGKEMPLGFMKNGRERTTCSECRSKDKVYLAQRRQNPEWVSRPDRKPQLIEVEGQMVGEIPLSHGKVALVSPEDYPEVSQHLWCAYSNHGRGWYAARNIVGEDGKMRLIPLHRLLLGLTDPKVQADHRDGNTLNNQRDNLRVATHAQNQANRGRQKNNTSGYKGVTWDKEDERWRATIYVNGKRLYLGDHCTKEAAARAYDEAAVRYHGEFAVLNLPPNTQFGEGETMS